MKGAFRLFIPALLLAAGCTKFGNTTATTVPSLTLAFAGDVMLERRILPVLRSGTDPFAEVAPVLRQATVALVNLETTVATNGDVVPGKPYVFMSAPGTLALLTNAGIDVVGLANNHSMDYGAKALRQTLRNLDVYRLLHTGAGTNLTQASEPVIVTTNGIRLGILAFGDIYPEYLYSRGNNPGIAGIYPLEVAHAIRALRPKVDFLVVLLHTGIEYHDLPERWQIGYGHKFVDSGADLVIMHHPHVTQGIEKYKNGVIFYSVGNFVFDQWKSPTRISMIGQVELTRTAGTNGTTNLTARYFVTPVMKDQSNYCPHLARGADLDAVTNRILTLSRTLGRRPLRFVLHNTRGYTNFQLDWGER